MVPINSREYFECQEDAESSMRQKMRLHPHEPPQAPQALLGDAPGAAEPMFVTLKS